MSTAVSRWQCVGADPGEFSSPAQLAPLWNDGFVLNAPSTVSAARRAVELPELDDLDALDWWLRAENLTGTVVFEGLTPPCTIYAGAQPIADVESMFLPITINLPPGEHSVYLHCRSVRSWLQQKRPRGRWRSSLASEQRLRWLRTTLLGRAHIYSAQPPPIGPWRPVICHTGPYLTELNIDTATTNGIAQFTGCVSGAKSHLEIAIDGYPSVVGRCADDGHFSVSVAVPDVRIWWPRGYGDQPLYQVTLTVDDIVIERRKIGFRTVKIDQRDGGFTVVVNGVPVFARGAVWMPTDPVSLWSETARLREAIGQYAECGANMFRIPGGTVPEQREFYDLCAEFGILLWHDSMLATFDPPQELTATICAELKALLQVLAGNPALAVLSGGNETRQQPEMMGLPSEEITIPIIDSALREIADQIPYIAASPFSPAPALAITPDRGVAHWFGVGGYMRPLTDVAAADVRFAAESLAFSIPPDDADCTQSSWTAGIPHDRGADWDFEDVRDKYVADIFRVIPERVRDQDPVRYLDLGRAAVAEAMGHCFRYWRRADSQCGGALVLCARDIATGAGWGLIDVAGRPKAPLAVLRRIWAAQAATISDAGMSGLRIDLYNDDPHILDGQILLTATSLHGTIVADEAVPITIAGHGSRTFYDAEITGRFMDLSYAYRFGEPVATAVECVLATSDGTAISRDSIVLIPTDSSTVPTLDAQLSERAGHWTLSLRASAALRYVVILTASHQPSDNWFHLLAGYDHVISMGASPDPPRGTIRSLDLDRPIAIPAPSEGTQ